MRVFTSLVATALAGVMVLGGGPAVPVGEAAVTPLGSVSTDCGAPGAGGYLEHLAVTIGARPYGTTYEQKAAGYITTELQKCGYDVVSQPVTAGKKKSANVIATWTGNDASKEIIVGAHYDSVTTAKGADDNASGVAAMLALAARIATGDVTPRYTVKFIAFGAEENWTMYGSDQFVKAYVKEGADTQSGSPVPIIAMINLDCLAVGDIAYVHGDDTEKTNPALHAWVAGVVDANRLGLDYDGDAVISDAELVDTSVNQSDLWDDSDYYNFYRAGVPFLYFEATNWRIGYQDGFTQVGPIGTTWYGKKGAIYHTRFDTVAYIDTIPAYSNKSGVGQRIGDRMAVFGDLLDRIVRDYEA